MVHTYIKRNAKHLFLIELYFISKRDGIIIIIEQILFIKEKLGRSFFTCFTTEYISGNIYHLVFDIFCLASFGILSCSVVFGCRYTP